MLDQPGFSVPGAVYYHQPDAGHLMIEGPDSRAFLQRQTTNDISLLSAERTLLTVLVNAAARILDVLRLIHLGPERVEVITLPGHAADTAAYWRKRIFFMDKVTLQDASQAYTQFHLDGLAAAQALAALGCPHPPALDGIFYLEHNGFPLWAFGQSGLAGTGYGLLLPVEGIPALLASLDDAGVQPLSPSEYNILRIEAGLPAAGFELTPEYTPFEAGLAHAVSGAKGCYTGQEVLARQVTYDKVTQHLVGLRLSAMVSTGWRVWHQERPVGQITSVALSPRFGPIGLAVLKKPAHLPGTDVIIKAEGEDPGIPAKVVALPFTVP